MALIRVPGNMRSRQMIETLNENNSQYAVLDQPECLRYIISIVELELGYLRVYECDRSNVASRVGELPFGYQDTVLTIITRGKARCKDLEPPVDLTDIVCP